MMEKIKKCLECEHHCRKTVYSVLFTIERIEHQCKIGDIDPVTGEVKPVDCYEKRNGNEDCEDYIQKDMEKEALREEIEWLAKQLNDLRENGYWYYRRWRKGRAE